MPVTREVLDQIALSEAEYHRIVALLGREPNGVELGMYGALWSEHCGYKHSRPLLRLFPSQAPWVLTRQGQENAGAVDIGGGMAVVFKMESHNHPSAVEPFHGAATGVGGIVRDILAMGARPIALLNSLRFGPLDDPHNRYLFHGVVGGISWYGNCIGVPDVGGEVYFSPSYSHNPLVNAMCVGLVPSDKVVRATTGQDGNILLLVGAGTGRDGIHGASGLASRTFEAEEELRPTVQVADPFTGKLLIEACLEVAATGCLVGMQDLGAAGLTSSTVEAAHHGGTGVTLSMDQVPQRESGMSPYEIMLSESQERMLLITLPEHQERLSHLLTKWDLPCVEIGHATSDNQVKVTHSSMNIASLPIASLTQAPTYRIKGSRDVTSDRARRTSPAALRLPDHDPAEVLLRIMSSPNVASRRGIYQQYDHHVQTNTLVGPGADAAVVRIKDTTKAIALCTDGNGRYCYLDPYIGGAIAVAEACRNLSCIGARPLAITDCLNFGNPQRPEVYHQLEWCIRGMARACKVLGVPVVSGNVSLYNETQGQAIYPTPVVGGLGLLQDARLTMTPQFKEAGHLVMLLGAGRVTANTTYLAGSEYLELVHQTVIGQPSIDLSLERRLQRLCRNAIEQEVLRSAHDCSDGGLAVALAECCIPSNIGFTGTFSTGARWDATLFGERQSRVVISLMPENLPRLRDMARQEGVPLTLLGTTGGDHFSIKGILDIALAQIEEAWSQGLERTLS